MNEHISVLHTDKYQLTMMYAHFKNGTHLHQRAFDLYFRKLPFGNGYTVFAGLERAVRYLMNLHFTEEDIEYIKSFDEPFDPAFYDYLRNFRFTGNIYALPEGTLTFPGVPMLRAEGSIIELQLIETALLNFIGFQSLVATKAARIRHVAPDEQLMEFGTRRAQEKDASVWGARAAYLAGFDATSNTLAGKKFGIPTSGTHAHAWIQDFPERTGSVSRLCQSISRSLCAFGGHVQYLAKRSSACHPSGKRTQKTRKNPEGNPDRQRGSRLFIQTSPPDAG